MQHSKYNNTKNTAMAPVLEASWPWQAQAVTQRLARQSKQHAGSESTQTQSNQTNDNNNNNNNTTPRVLSQQQLQHIEQRVIKQLLQALLFEEIIDYQYHPISENSVSSDLQNVEHTFVIPVSDEISYIANGAIHYSFDLIRFNDKEVQRVEQGHSQPATLEGVINDIILNIDSANIQSIQAETGQPKTATNQSPKLVQSFIKELRHTLINEIQAQAMTPYVPTDIQALTYPQLEGYLMAGHPYHPCFKSRIGFNLNDNYQYGPEFAHNIEVIWLAVDHRLLVSNSVESGAINDWVKQYLGNDDYEALMTTLKAIVANDKAYGLLPVHPWQWQNTLIYALQPLLNTQQVVYLGPTDTQYQAQQSIRSLSMLSEGKPYLKLSMHLINTSSTRILAKHTVMNAAVVTQWLNQLIAEDDTAAALNIAFLGETVGVSLDHEVLREQGYQHPDIYGGLGAIWRENVSEYLSVNQQAFPLNGVSYINSDGSLLIDPWIQKHGVARWIKQLIEVSTLPIIHMLFAHGVALECHAQNIVLVHEEGYPVKVLLKDLHDGIRYSPEHLARQDLRPNFFSLPAAHAALNRGSFIETDDTDGIRDMTVACLFFVAFADMAIFMQTHYDYPEQQFWQQVAQCISEYQAAHPEHHERYKLFDVFAQKTRIESLAKRRLFGDAVFPIKYLNNPLYKAAGRLDAAHEQSNLQTNNKRD